MITIPGGQGGGGRGGGQGIGRGGRGQGGGRGNGQRPGVEHMCVCPECGTTEVHRRGQPCRGMKCPRCGAAMTRQFAGGDI